MNHIDRLIQLALEEDIGTGDATTRAIFGRETVQGRGRIIAKQAMVLSGIEVAQRVFTTVDPGIEWTCDRKEGDSLETGSLIATILGQVSSLLTAERTALNFLQRLSGIATLTASFVEKVKESKLIVRGTRKTSPGLRSLSKQAVRSGGGKNHRFGLWDQFLVKDNHIAAAGSIRACVKHVREGNPQDLKVQVEVRTPEEAAEAVEARVDSILLDNMTFEMAKEIADRWRDQVELEASGNVTLENVVQWSKTGVHAVSVGALTHSAPAVDISMEVCAI